MNEEGKKEGKGKRNSANVKVITVAVSSTDGAWGGQVQTGARWLLLSGCDDQLLIFRNLFRELKVP